MPPVAAKAAAQPAAQHGVVKRPAAHQTKAPAKAGAGRAHVKQTAKKSGVALKQLRTTLAENTVGE
jgi:hypothetical protein